MSNKRSISSEKHGEESKKFNGTRFAVSFAVVAMLAFTAFALSESSGNAAATPWDGKAAEWFIEDEQAFATSENGIGEPGSETNPFLISSAGELKLLADMINDNELTYDEKIKYNTGDVYYELTCDILLNDTSSWETWNNENRPLNEWVPIGLYKEWELIDIPFEANFDGGEHAVSGLYINDDHDYQGLFGYATGNISNLGVEQSYVQGNSFFYSNATGSVAGTAGNVTNCYNKGTVIGVSNSNAVGGVVGRANNVTDCYNEGTVINNNYDLGSAAGVVSGSSGDVTNCYNAGTVTSNSYFDSAYGVVSYSNGNVTNCYNTGAVISTLFINSYYGGSSIGVGRAAGDMISCYNDGDVISAFSATGVGRVGGNMIDCYNIGSITSERHSTGVGGADGDMINCYNIGDISGLSIAGVGGASGDMINCYNTANFISEGSATGIGSAGGSMIGCYNTANITCEETATGIGIAEKMVDCYNKGDMSAVWDAAGVGNAEQMVDCYNTGNITGGYCAGGVIGYNYNMIDIIGCYNTGNVTGGQRAGGVVGEVYNHSSFDNNRITSCYNTGNVTGINNVGGIVGFMDIGNPVILNITSCYNSGNVIGNDNVGGVIGHILSYLVYINHYGDNIKIMNCYNTGNIIGNDYVGGVVGSQIVDYKGTLEIMNCYNAGNVIGNDYVGGIKGNGFGSISYCYFLKTESINTNLDAANGGSISNTYDFDGSGTIRGTVTGLLSVPISNPSLEKTLNEWARANDFGRWIGTPFPTLVNVPILYEIIYENLNGATNEKNPSSYTKGTSEIMLKAPSEITGFVFKEWILTDEEGNVIESITEKTVGNITIWAVWDEIFEITYENMNGASHDNPSTYIAGTSVTLKEPGKVAGFVFKEWILTDKNGKVIESITEETVGNITISAVWDEVFEITYENLNGASHDNPLSYTNGTSTITLKDPAVIAGFVFIEWRITNENGEVITSITSENTGNITIWAVWDEVFEITYENTNGASHDNPSTYIAGTSVTLKEPGKVAGFVFIEWRITDGNGKVITSITSENTGNITIWAVWDEVFEITYVNLNGASNENPLSYTAGTDEITLVAPGDVTGSVFKEWRTADGNVITSITSESTGNLILYAVWGSEAQDEVYKIVYVNLNGASNDNPLSYTAGTDEITLVAPGEFAGYVFKEWRLIDEDGNGEVITSITSESTGVLVLYAVWESESQDEVYKIVYVNLKGASNENPLSYTAGTSVVLAAPGEIIGSVFKEWRLVDEKGNVVTSITSESTGDLVLYAVWSSEAQQYAGGSLLDNNMILILLIMFIIAALSVNTVLMRKNSKKS